MKTPSITVNAAQAMKGTTLRIKVVGAGALAFRIKVDSTLMRLAAFIMGCNVEVNLK